MQSPPNAQREQLMTVPVSVSVSDLEANPHDLHARCREEHPMVYVRELDAFLVTRWDDVRAVCSVGSFQFRSAEQFADAPRRAEHAAQRGREPSAGQSGGPASVPATTSVA